MEKEGEVSPRPPLAYIRGVPVYGFVGNNWAEVEGFQARPDDLLICTYPKSGTTWVSEIVDLILNNGDVEKTNRDAIAIRVPYLEFAAPGFPFGTELLVNAPSPRFIKTHMTVGMLQKTFWENNCKIIYVARNAKDVAVSFYHFDKMALLHPDPGTWDEFLENYMAGKVSYGSWYDHVKGWWEKTKDHQILYLFYEDLKEDPKREIRKIMQFIEKELGEEIVERIYHHTMFCKMKDNLMTNYKTVPTNVLDQKVSPFMRKGIVGDWKNHFTVAQSERFDEDYKKKMAGSSLRFRTEL
ncbi:sulfotransferase 1 family member D1-like [Pleurodeles waltl]|uniref:sulfotransferase 1 family member D1-like n=1 Tax=Pleurodeles waltl TaxID=8319 RepID=UPI00370990E6